jgi:hypothetical protein
MHFEKLPIGGYKNLGMYPVYIDGLYDRKEPFKVVGIREDSAKLYKVMNKIF